MKKIHQLSALTLLLASTTAFAHHPAADIVDPDVYAMIEENISDVHLAMTFDDMGSDTTDTGGSMAARDDDAGNMDTDMGAETVAEMSSDLAEVGAAMESREEMGSMTDVEPGGSMGSQR